jgi:toxin ParE1/3/4
VSAGTRHWTVRLTAAAEGDFQHILRWTVAHFGEAQARTYAETLSAAIEALAAGPTTSGATQRHDITKGLLTLHVARQGRKGRHIVLFRVGLDQEREVIEVLRLLHDAMDLQRHLPPADERVDESPAE